MKVSTKGRYALQLMVDLALHDTGEYISLKDISERKGITVKYLEQIVTVLAKAGFVLSQRGNNGGYRLARAPKDYTAGDILRVMEGPMEPIACLQGEENLCEKKGSCVTLPFWNDFSKVINRFVDSVTLQDLKDQALSLSGYDYSI